MSYDIDLKDPTGKVIEVPRHTEGATYCLEGTTEADLNITCNYSPYFYEHIDDDTGIRWIYKRPLSEVIPVLLNAVVALGTKRDSDYWKRTPGNAGYALNILLLWAIHAEANIPNCQFDGD